MVSATAETPPAASLAHFSPCELPEKWRNCRDRQRHFLFSNISGCACYQRHCRASMLPASNARSQVKRSGLGSTDGGAIAFRRCVCMLCAIHQCSHTALRYGSAAALELQSLLTAPVPCYTAHVRCTLKSFAGTSNVSLHRVLSKVVHSLKLAAQAILLHP